MTMEGALRDHPLWAGASDNEIDCAMEVMYFSYPLFYFVDQKILYCHPLKIAGQFMWMIKFKSPL